MTWRREAAVPFVLIGLFAFLARPVLVMKDNVPERILWLWAWSEGNVSFVNSVTGRGVVITFSPRWRFSGFRAVTDGETEAYYTGGTYRWNDVLGRERRKTLTYCSAVGVTLCFDGRCLTTSQGCLTAEVLWPP